MKLRANITKKILKIITEINGIENKSSRKNIQLWFFGETLNKIDTSLARLTKNLWEKTQIVKISNVRKNYNAEPIEIKRLIKKYYENFIPISLGQWERGQPVAELARGPTTSEALRAQVRGFRGALQAQTGPPGCASTMSSMGRQAEGCNISRLPGGGSRSPLLPLNLTLNRECQGVSPLA